MRAAVPAACADAAATQWVPGGHLLFVRRFRFCLTIIISVYIYVYIYGEQTLWVVSVMVMPAFLTLWVVSVMVVLTVEFVELASTNKDRIPKEGMPVQFLPKDSKD